MTKARWFRSLLLPLPLLFLVATPLHAATEAPAAASPLVIGETFLIESKLLAETRRINVYKPHVYSEAIRTPLPVLYMPDGGLAEDFLHVAGLLQSQVDGGLMRPFLLVGIENTVRRRDLTGPSQDPRDQKIAPVIGGSAKFRQFIRDELMPRVRAGYATTDEAAVIGESLAGLFVVETYFEMPTLFSTYIALDPSLWWNDEYWPRQASARGAALAKAAAGNRLFLASSDEPGIARPTAELARLLQGAAPALSCVYEPMPQETHGTIYHPAALKAFRQMFRPPAPAAP